VVRWLFAKICAIINSNKVKRSLYINQSQTNDPPSKRRGGCVPYLKVCSIFIILLVLYPACQWFYQNYTYKTYTYGKNGQKVFSFRYLNKWYIKEQFGKRGVSGQPNDQADIITLYYKCPFYFSMIENCAGEFTASFDVS